VTKTSAPLRRASSSSESPDPAPTATVLTSRSGSPATRTPCAVSGSAVPTSAANARSVNGFGSLPTRPCPRVERGSSPVASPSGGSTSSMRSKAGSS
jgi:hypothetical protein